MNSNDDAWKKALEERYKETFDAYLNGSGPTKLSKKYNVTVNSIYNYLKIYYEEYASDEEKSAYDAKKRLLLKQCIQNYLIIS